MDEIITRVWQNLIGRADGPLTLRLILQPAMAIFLAVRAGIGDAQSGRRAFLWGVLVDPERRRDLLAHALGDVGKIFLMASVLDVVYQLIVRRWVYPLEVVLTAAILALVPYVIVRGPTGRVARIVIRKGALKGGSGA